MRAQAQPPRRRQRHSRAASRPTVAACGSFLPSAHLPSAPPGATVGVPPNPSPPPVHPRNAASCSTTPFCVTPRCGASSPACLLIPRLHRCTAAMRHRCSPAARLHACKSVDARLTGSPRQPAAQGKNTISGGAGTQRRCRPYHSAQRSPWARLALPSHPPALPPTPVAPPGG